MRQGKFTDINNSYNFHDDLKPVYSIPQGLSAAVVDEISNIKAEPSWLRKIRRQALQIFKQQKTPNWGSDLSKLNFNKIQYYIKPTERQVSNWQQVPLQIKKTFYKLGVPQAEAKFLAGSGAQYESEVVYSHLKQAWQKQGVIFCDLSSAVKLYPDIVKQYLGKLVPIADNKFSALNSAVWSGGSFVYVPQNVKVEVPLQTYFRLNAKNMGQFERTLIITEKGSQVSYVEGCTAPRYSVDSLHAAVVEIFAKPYSRIRYTTMQNWSNNVYNLVTKRALAEESATVEWVDGNFGSKLTMKYPAVILKGRGAKANMLSLAVASKKQHQDTGAKMVHLAADTSSCIISKSVSVLGGRTSYRGLVKVVKGAKNVKVKSQCDALLLDDASRADTYPTMQVDEPEVRVEHEASIFKIQQDQLFYLQSRGLSEDEAASMIVSGFIEPVSKELPMEYALELNRLIKLEMGGAVG